MEDEFKIIYKGGKHDNNLGFICPDVAPTSYILKDGMMIPVVFKTGQTVCGYCGALSTSYQGVHKHMRLNHEDEMKAHTQKMIITAADLMKNKNYKEGSTFALQPNQHNTEQVDEEEYRDSSGLTTGRGVKKRCRNN